jgi:predicted transcriptional regulator
MAHFGDKARALLDEKIAAEKNETVARRLKRLRQRLADVERKAETLATEIGQLIDALSDDSIDKRDEARVKLVTIGEAALTALEKAAASNNAEVRAHARAIASSIRRKIRY